MRVPHSVHRSAYGWIPIPIVRIKNGDGPNVLMQAGNHGDEWEGQIGLGNLIRAIEPKDIKGRLVILPSANFPAAMEGRRTSPIDEGNLNRSFPGDAEGTNHAADRLLDRARAAAGLRLRLRLPLRRQLAHLHSERAGATPQDAARMEKVMGLLKAFGAPVSYISAAPPGRRPHLHLGRVSPGRDRAWARNWAAAAW